MSVMPSHGDQADDPEFFAGVEASARGKAGTRMQAAAAPQQRRMSLAAVTKGKVAKPERIVIYGTEGIGKSTFAACAPSPIFICSERGTEHLDVARFPAPKSWRDVIEAIDSLITEDHTYRTLAIDSLDWLEPMVWAQTCAVRTNDSGKRVTHVEEYGFGKGYEYALDTWRELLGKLDALSERRRMHVICIAHSHVSTFKSPDTEDFQRYELALNRKAAAVWKQWPDHVLFAAHEILTTKQDRRAKGVSTGQRFVYTTKTAAYDAKNRTDGGMPERLPLSWDAFTQALAGETADTWRGRIVELLAGASEDIKARVNAAVTKAGDDVSALARIYNHLSVTVNGGTR
jgi:hypothetical protein